MSDVGIAPPPPSPPPSGETPVNQNPVNPPAPIGSQAPPAEGGDRQKAPATSRRESIQKAFQKSRDPEWQKSRPGPAQATKGHNNPPEDTPNERVSRDVSRETSRETSGDDPPLNLKKRPDDQEPRARGDGGRFAPKETANQQRAQPPQQAQRAANPLPAQAPYREPPARMADHAKREWHAAPESVRGEVYRMHRDFAAAHQRHQQLAAAFEPIRPYHELARQQGTTIDRALSNYTSIEHKLRSDPVGGLDLIVNNLNLRTQDGRRLGLVDIAWHVLNQSPEQRQLVQAGNAQAAHSQQLAALHQRNEQLAQGLAQMQYQQKFSHTRGAVDRFAETHPRLDELGPIIEHELKLGFSLEKAYQRAELLRPATHAAQTRNNQNTPAAQTRTPDRSIRGAPASPVNAGGNGARHGKPVSRRDALANAIRQVRGSH